MTERITEIGQIGRAARQAIAAADPAAGPDNPFVTEQKLAIEQERLDDLEAMRTAGNLPATYYGTAAQRIADLSAARFYTEAYRWASEDGTTDTAALQAAATAAAAADQGGVVVITDPLTVTSRVEMLNVAAEKTLGIVGEGPGAVVYNQSADGAIRVKGPDVTNGDGTNAAAIYALRLEHFTLVNEVAVTGADGLILVERAVHNWNIGNGVRIDGDNKARRGVVLRSCFNGMVGGPNSLDLANFERHDDSVGIVFENREDSVVTSGNATFMKVLLNDCRTGLLAYSGDEGHEGEIYLLNFWDCKYYNTDAVVEGVSSTMTEFDTYAGGTAEHGTNRIGFDLRSIIQPNFFGCQFEGTQMEADIKVTGSKSPSLTCIGGAFWGKTDSQAGILFADDVGHQNVVVMGNRFVTLDAAIKSNASANDRYWNINSNHFDFAAGTTTVWNTTGYQGWRNAITPRYGSVTIPAGQNTAIVVHNLGHTNYIVSATLTSGTVNGGHSITYSSNQFTIGRLAADNGTDGIFKFAITPYYDGVATAGLVS